MNTNLSLIKKTLILFIIHCSLFSIHCFAQPAQLYSLEYSTGTLSGPSRSFVSTYSWSGVQINGQVFLIDNLALGFKVGYNKYDSKIRPRTFEYGNGLRVYAYTFRNVSQVPIQIGVIGHIIPNSIIKPYIGIFLGLSYANQTVMIQKEIYKENNFGFSLTPEIGFFLQFGRNQPMGIKFSGAYNMATNHYAFGVREYKNLQSFNLNLGLSYMIRHK